MRKLMLLASLVATLVLSVIMPSGRAAQAAICPVTTTPGVYLTPDQLLRLATHGATRPLAQ